MSIDILIYHFIIIKNKRQKENRLFMQSYHSLSAQVYQIDKPIGCSFGDVEYYQERLKDVNGKILEPAVGTGRILIPLLKAGFNVEGFDLSDEMLYFCMENLRRNGYSQDKVTKDNLLTFQVETLVDAIIIPTGTFLLLDSETKALQSLQQCYNALNPGGRLLIDISLAHTFTQGQCSSRQFETPEGDLITLQIVNAEIDYINQLTVSHHRYDKWRNGKIIESEWEVFKLKWFGVYEFKRLLESIGFDKITISGDYQYLREPNNETEIITFEAYK
ncbi:class I SAM-dependent methyltransferase [Proteus terrae]|uniref:class I SAM-dependent methyltransferase n=2 Tax=Morganellaceae TaxID=1903414 RepID=UPI001E28E4A4|nr:class I SAM-dependent methyltransferase [Proteus terrae]MCT8262476.1 class I SAM-dependent methyltransferase [Proteus terrae]